MRHHVRLPDLRPTIEALEPRLLLAGAPSIDAISAAHPDFRFIAGADLPAVQETFTAQVSGTATSVRFAVGGLSVLDSNPSDGWSATFNMSTAANTNDLIVTATGPQGSDNETYDVNLLLLPAWLHGSDVDFTAIYDWSTGYSFDVTVKHLDLGFDTPADWVFRIPGVSEPLFDLANKHTGFLVQSTFDLVSAPSGLVTSSNYELGMDAWVLGETVFEKTIGFTASGSTSYEADFGPAHVEGNVSYGAAISPHFSTGLVLDGISGNLWLDPTLTVTMPLGEARIPLLTIPGLADLVFGAEASMTFGTTAGHAHMLELTPKITSGGLGLDVLELNPSVSASLTGYGEVDIFLGAGTAGASITGTLTQGLAARYTSVSGWTTSAPGNLTLSGDVYYDTLWGFGPSGSLDLFEWEIPSWDFLSHSGSATQATQTHNYDSGVLTDPWISSIPGPHDSLTFQVDYANPGSAPQIARVIVDGQHSYDMTLVGGTADNGSYATTIVGVAQAPHGYGFVFVDQEGDYHVQTSDHFPRVNVVQIDPVDGGPMVARSANVRVTFDKEMDPTTLNSSTVTVVGSSSGLHAGSYTYNSKVLTIDPAVDFSWGETVTVTVTRNAIAADGTRIGSDFVSRFTTLASTPTPISVGGTLSTSTTWTSGNVYLLTSSLTISAGATLTIEPGVVVKLGTARNSYRTLTVNGTLDLRGTAGQKVVFTSGFDDTYGGDTNGDGTASSPLGYDWGYIQYTNPANVLHDAVVRYGGYQASAYMVYVSGSSAGTMEIRDCIIENSPSRAIYVDGSQAPNIHDNTIRSATYGVNLATTGVPTIQNNAFTGNTYPIYQGGGEAVYGGNTFSGNTWTAIAVGGSLNQNVVWEDVQGAGMPYLVVADLTVPVGRVLTIDPGIVVKMWSDLVVNGTLDLRGTASQKVVFTSRLDDTYGGDTNGDGTGSSPSASNWGYIQYTNPANVLHDALIRYGGNMVWVSGSSAGTMEIRDCVLENTGSRAINVDGSQAPNIHHNTIRNATYGVYLGTTGVPTIQNNAFAGNTYPIYQGGGEAVYGGNTFTGNTWTAIAVGGSLNQDVVWEDAQGAGMPYLVVDNLTIPAGRVLTIQPGIVVKLGAANGVTRCLFVDGTLDLRGTAGQKVVFTSGFDDTYGGDTNGDGTASSPLGNYWGYIKYTNPANVLHDAVVRYGGNPSNMYYMVWVSGSSAGTMEIRDCVLENCSYFAIYVDGSQAPNIHHNTIRNSAYGVYLATTGVPTIQNNAFTGNTYLIYQGGGEAVYGGNTFSGNTWTAIAVGGTIAQDSVWEDNGLPYLLTTSDITLPAGKTLTVNNGVVVKFQSARKLTVQGSLFTNNTYPPVVFTSYRDDSYGGDTNGGGLSSGSAGDWAGIYFQTTSNTFDHAVVRYAGLNISGPAVTIRQATFDYTPDPAIRLASGGGAGTSVRASNFLHAVGYGVRNDTTNTIDAVNSYWGQASGPGGVGPGSGAGVTTYVTYSPWLTSPASMTATGPVITSSPQTSAVILSPYAYDADGRASASGIGTLVWSRILGPTDFIVNSGTGEITWLPITPGDYVMGIAATDDIGSTDQIWQIRVAASGDITPPIIVSYANQIIGLGGGLVQATLVSTFSEGVQVRPVDVALLDAGGQPVPIDSLSYDIANHRLTVVAQNLTANANYTFRLLDTITDDALNPLDGEFDGYTFPTGNGAPGGMFAKRFFAGTVQNWLGSVDEHWETEANWLGQVVPDPQMMVVFEDAAPHDPVLQRDETVAGVDLRTAGWTVGGSGSTLTVGPGGIDSAGAGTSAVGPDVTLAADSTWTVGDGNTLILTGTIGGGGNTLTKEGPGTLVLAGGQDHTSGLAMDLRAGTVEFAPGVGTLVLGGLSIAAASAALDLTNGSLVVDYTGKANPFADIQRWVLQAWNNDAWDGNGITSSTAALDPVLYGVAVADNNSPDMLLPYGDGTLYPKFGNVTPIAVALESVLVKLTYRGDVNLDGVVDDLDVALIGLFYDGGSGPGGKAWFEGDIYLQDGYCDDNDVAMMGLTYGYGWLIGDPLGGGAASAVTLAAPTEPAAQPAAVLLTPAPEAPTTLAATQPELLVEEADVLVYTQAASPRQAPLASASAAGGADAASPARMARTVADTGSAFLPSLGTSEADNPPLLLLTAASTPLAWSTAEEVSSAPDAVLSPDGGVEGLLSLPALEITPR